MTDVVDTPSHEEVLATMTGGLLPQGVTTFAGSDRLRPDGRPKPELRRELRQIADMRNAFVVLAVLALPALLVWAVVALDHWVAVVAAIPVMASAQLRFYILHHEAAHRLLFSNRRINDIVGVNILGWLPLGTGTHGYRRGHVNHHRDEFGPKEPDFLLYSLYPISRSSMRRKVRRDATGVSGWRIIKPRFTGLLQREHLPISLRFFAGQALVFCLFALAGSPWLYIFLWVVPYLTWYQVVNRLRSIAEHAGMTRSDDRRLTSHIVEQSPIARLLFAPFNVGYHLAHHVDSGVPFRNLPRLRQILIEDGYVHDTLIWPSYRSLWRALVKDPAS